MSTNFNTKFRQNIISFAWTWVALLILIGIFSLFTIWSMNRAYHQSDARTQAISNLNNQILSAQVDFKIQVQEWKNTLLRGKNSADRDMYFSRFVQQEDKVHTNLNGAFKACASLKINFDCQKIVAVSNVHLKMGSTYKEKLMAGSLENYEAIHKIDQSLRGIDRDLENNLDTLSLDLLKVRTKERLSTQSFLDHRYSSLRKFIIIVMSLALIVTIFSLYSVLRALPD